MPAPVLREAANFQRQHFADYALAGRAAQLDMFNGSDSVGDGEVPAMCGQLCERLRSFDLERSTPLEAMRFVESLQAELE